MNTTPRQLLARYGGVLAVMLFWTEAALAHPQKGEAVGFLTGFRHPISGLDHVLAMVAVGLWGAQLGAPAVWVLPVAFPMVMAFGGMLGLMGVPLPGVEFGIALSAILLGAAVLFELHPPLGIAAALVGSFVIFDGALVVWRYQVYSDRGSRQCYEIKCRCQCVCRMLACFP